VKSTELPLPRPLLRVPRLPWPLPALLTWALAWAVFAAAQQLGLPVVVAWVLASLLGGVAASRVHGRWRQLLVAGGFVLSSLAVGAAVPAWLWLVAALPLLAAYPLRAWTDAPFFPTPARALLALRSALPLPDGARVLDAGCGLGHGLKALQAAWPTARIEGVEWSAALAAACAWRCRFAQVRRADMWVCPWAGLDVVYLFQRPESMVRAWTKAQAEMDPGRWLVSLEFAIPGVEPHQRLDAGGGRPLWVYRVPLSAAAGSKKARRGR
jgi:hypothetical protein